MGSVRDELLRMAARLALLRLLVRLAWWGGVAALAVYVLYLLVRGG